MLNRLGQLHISKIGRRLLLLTTDPAGAAGVGSVPTLLRRISQRVPVIADVTLATFLSVLGNEDVGQVVLVAREQDGGLVFSDRWVSLAELGSEIEDVLEDVATPPVLFLVSNGGAELQMALSDTSRFGRVLSVKYVLGQLDTFESALDTVAQMIEISNNAVAALTKEDFGTAVAAAGPLAAVLTAAARPDGRRVHVDVGRLLDEVGRTDASADDVIGLHRRLMSSAGARAVDVDATVTRVAAERVSKAAGTRKARSELSALVQTKYE